MSEVPTNQAWSAAPQKGNAVAVKPQQEGVGHLLSAVQV